MNPLSGDSNLDDYQEIIDLMARVGWIKSAREDADDIAVEWTELGQVKCREMASLVKPFIAWLCDRTGTKPDREDQLICANSLAPYARELGWATPSETESLKLIVFIAMLAPE